MYVCMYVYIHTYYSRSYSLSKVPLYNIFPVKRKGLLQYTYVLFF